MAPEPRAQRWARIREERREQILAGASRVFARHGVKKSSMALVAKESEATKVTVYAHFRSKDRLTVAVLQRWLSAIANETSSARANAADDLHDVLWSIAESVVRVVKSEAYLSLSRAIGRAEGIPDTVLQQWAPRFDRQRALLMKTFLACGSPDANEHADIFLYLLERQSLAESTSRGAGPAVRLFLAAYRDGKSLA